MFKWIINKIGAPLFPILQQAYKVLKVAEGVIDEAITAGDTLGVSDKSIFDLLRLVLNIVSTVKTVIEKVLSFFGVETMCVVGMSEPKDLSAELAKLKSLI